MCVFLQKLLQFSLQQIQNSKKILSIVKCPPRIPICSTFTLKNCNNTRNGTLRSKCCEFQLLKEYSSNKNSSRYFLFRRRMENIFVYGEGRRVKEFWPFGEGKRKVGQVSFSTYGRMTLYPRFTPIIVKFWSRESFQILKSYIYVIYEITKKYIFYILKGYFIYFIILFYNSHNILIFIFQPFHLFIHFSLFLPNSFSFFHSFAISSSKTSQIIFVFFCFTTIL